MYIYEFVHETLVLGGGGSWRCSQSQRTKLQLEYQIMKLKTTLNFVKAHALDLLYFFHVYL